MANQKKEANHSDPSSLHGANVEKSDTPPPASGDYSERKKALEVKIQAKLQSQKIKEEQHISNKIEEMNRLKEEKGEIEKELKQAEDTLEYFISQEEKNLLDEEDMKEKEAIQKDVEDLRNSYLQIETEINSILSQPEVQERLEKEKEKEEKEKQTQKEQEEKERALKEILEKTQQELEPEVDALAEEIKFFFEKNPMDYEKLHGNIHLRTERRHNYFSKYVESVVLADMKDFDYLEFKGLIYNSFYKTQTVEEYQKSLEAIYRNLGFFQRKEKKAIKLLFSDKNYLEGMEQLEGAISEAQKVIDGNNEKLKGFSKRWREIITKAWEAQEKMNEIAKPGMAGYKNSLPLHLNKRLEAKIMGGLSVSEQEKEQKQYLDKVSLNIKNFTFNIKREAGGDILLYNPPQKKKSRIIEEEPKKSRIVK